MWTRRELKDKAKASLRGNYWKAVLVGLLLAALLGGGAGLVAGGVGGTGVARVVWGLLPDGGEAVESVSVETHHVDEDLGGDLGVGDPETHHELDRLMRPEVIAVLVVRVVGTLAIVVAAIAVALFVLGPLEVGARRFFLRNLNQRAEVREVAYGYDHNYLEVVKTVFLRDLYVFLWSLLLVVPGVVKAYEWRLVPYLMAEDPTMTRERAFAESRRLMDGQKWDAFVLDLSFLGWDILSALTLGILAVFYVAPYRALTDAALYERLAYGQPAAPGEGGTATTTSPDGFVSAGDLPPVPMADAMQGQGAAGPSDGAATDGDASHTHEGPADGRGAAGDEPDEGSGAAGDESQARTSGGPEA